MTAEIVNQVTGEVLLTDSDERSYRLLFDLAAVMKLEGQMGRSVLDVLAVSPSVTDLVRMIICGSEGYGRRHKQRRPITGTTLALKVITDCGGFQNVGVVVYEALSRAEGLGLYDGEEEAEPVEAEGGDDHDPPAGPGRVL